MKNRCISKFVLLGFVYVISNGCGLLLAPSASKILDADPNMASHCVYVGDVEGETIWWMFTDPKTFARGQAYNMGATHVAWTSKYTSGWFSKERTEGVMGHAYKCGGRRVVSHNNFNANNRPIEMSEKFLEEGDPEEHNSKPALSPKVTSDAPTTLAQNGQCEIDTDCPANMLCLGSGLDKVCKARPSENN